MFLLLLTSMALCAATPVLAAQRHRTETRRTDPGGLLLPAAVAPAALAAPIISGLDYSAVAPPGVRLRVVEDEPYILALAGRQTGRMASGEGITRLVLVAHTLAVDGVPLGSYTAQITLRLAGQPGYNGNLAQAFDAAAGAAYRRSILRLERREAVAYSIDEVRSPLGLTNPRDRANSWREYLAYTAEAINPDSAEGQVRLTPYQIVNGELRVLRLIEHRESMLCISFTAQEFPHSITLTENIARCILNRLVAARDLRLRLEYLAYYPEAEPALLRANEVLDARTADLAEQPGTGCGAGPLPIQGDACPGCSGEGPFWQARPYADTLYLHVLAAEVKQAVCSHCLLGPARDAVKQLPEQQPDPAGCAAPPQVGAADETAMP